jgi:hypothetical protein
MMDTAKLLMVAALPRSAAGGATETRAEVNRAAPKREVVVGKPFVPTGTKANEEFTAVTTFKAPSLSKRYVAIAGDTHSFKDGEPISVVDAPNWKNLPSGWAYFQGNDGIQQLLAPEDFKEAPEAAQSSGWTSALGAGSKLLIIGNAGDFHSFATGDVVTVEALEEHKANGDPMPGRLIAKGPNGNVQILYAEHYKRI